MTSLRPDAGQEGPYAQGAYEPDGTFEAAVEQLADPLNDPLPGQFADPLSDPLPGGHTSPWFRAEEAPADGGAPQMPRTTAQGPMEPPGEWYDPEGYQRDWYGRQGPGAAPAAGTVQGTAVISGHGAPPPVRTAPGAGPAQAPSGAYAEPVVPVEPAARHEPVGPVDSGARHEPVVPVEREEPVTDVLPVLNDETVALRTADTRRASDAAGSGTAESSASEQPPTGGRAERRRAAKGRGRRQVEPRRATESGAAEPAAPMSRLEARRAARAAKDSPAVVASRVIGEVFITFGVLMLLFVTYQLWWTNVRADQIAGRETSKIQDDWANGARSPGAFEPGQGFAIMHIPKLDVVAPIAEGISKEKVLDRGMVGHYGEGKLKTAMPSEKQGNFAVAGHRNTHGEPFRYINKLKPGDPIVVETQDAYYTYEMTSILPQTSPSNVAVIDEVPTGSGFTGPGRYITLTTCTPEFTSTYRMIVWGKMVEERPRSKGKPDALVG
ncbi:class E sortase [Streptomyces sp. gb1(2016)]|uniref:Class E sortase n=1 Tax=Streptomyces sp. gb1(2016) TaxID=1828321 RepID=A0A652KHW6_9ACTN|nr:class E sortase [Streptomyces sp. gb1(2016)]TXS23186.1 class E sortase [Streptomyces sp. gb1(2016)]